MNRALTSDDKLAVMTRAARMLASSGDFASTLEQTILACLPALGDYGFFDLRVDAQNVVRTARAHDDARIEAILRPTQWVRSERTDMNLCALSSGAPGLHPAIDDAWYQAIAVNEGHLGLLRTLGFRSMLTVPMRYQDELVGAFTLFFGASGRQHDEEHATFAHDLATLVAPVVVNARLAERLRRAEERLRLAVEAGELGIWDWDLVNDVVVWSDRMYEMYGVRPGDFGGRGEHVLALVHRDDRGRLATALHESLVDRTSYEVEFRMQRGDEMRYFASRADVMRDAKGHPLRMVGATWDITERERRRREAESANRAKDEFLAVLGHELRNPLAPILSAVRLMNLRGDDGTRREREIIDRQVAHLSRLVDDLLDVSRIVRGKVEIARERIDLRVVVDKAIEMASPLLGQQRIALDPLLGSAPAWVDGDAMRLAQVVSNLLTNAAKFSPRGGAVTIDIGRDVGMHVVTVRDRGVGIAPELLPHVFEMFVQGPQTIERRDGGLGLGLAIVSNLVSLHGGRVRAHSDGPGRGATFTVELPAADGAPARATAPSTVTPRTRTGRVLLVDDNADAATLLAEELREVGFDVRTAGDGFEALALAAGSAPDLAILDIGLPGMTGYELARRLRALPGLASLPLVALTGYGLPADREQAASAGFNHHLTKPIAPEILIARIDELLAR